MKRTRVLFSGFIGIIVLLAVACGGSATSTTQPTATSEATTAPTSPAETPTATTAAGETPTTSAEETPTTPDNGGNGDPQAGQEVFTTAGGCGACHTIEGVSTGPLGPELTHIATEAETMVEGQSAEEYIHESIVDPSAFVVEGFTDGLMPQTFEDTLSSEQIDNLVAYLLTLE